MPSNLQLSLWFANGIRHKSTGDRYFLSDDGIEGCIEIYNYKHGSFDLVKISFEGTSNFPYQRLYPLTGTGLLLNTIRSADWPRSQQKDNQKLQLVSD